MKIIYNMLALILTSVAGVNLDPTQIITLLDNKYASLWNAHDYQQIVNELFHKDAMVIPPKPNKFIEHSDLVNWFPSMDEYWGNNMTMTPELVTTVEEEFGCLVIHEIGRWKDIYNAYYQRWINHNGSWLITFAAIAIGPPEPNSTSPHSPSSISSTSGHDPTELIAKMEKKFDDRYNVQDFAGVAALFDIDSLLIPWNADGFCAKNDLTEYFRKAYNEAGLLHANTKPVIVIQQNPSVIHELGGIQVNNQTQFLPYYVRWVRNITAWKINFYISVFPVPHLHDREIN